MKTFNEHIESALITFVAMFFMMLSITISDPAFTFTKEALGSAVVAAIFAAVRALALVIVDLAKAILNRRKELTSITHVDNTESQEYD